MTEPAKENEKVKKVLDEGIEVGASRLTPERIEKVINSVIKGETGARLKTYVETCIQEKSPSRKSGRAAAARRSPS